MTDQFKTVNLTVDTLLFIPSCLPDPQDREGWEALGLRFGNPLEDGVVAVEMPLGWSTVEVALGWFELRDAKGRRRGGYAQLTGGTNRMGPPECRFRIEIDRQEEFLWAVVKDVGREVFRSGVARSEDDAVAECERWLDVRFPEHADPTAYWD